MPLEESTFSHSHYQQARTDAPILESCLTNDDCPLLALLCVAGVDRIRGAGRELI